MTKEFTVKTSEESYNLTANVRLIGEDLLVAIWGGDRYHIGAVSCAHPRPSLKNPEVTSSTASVICLTGHKEDELAKAVSEILSSAFKVTTVVTAGMHWDVIDKNGIKKVKKNCEILVDLMMDKIIKYKKIK